MHCGDIADEAKTGVAKCEIESESERMVLQNTKGFWNGVWNQGHAWKQWWKETQLWEMAMTLEQTMRTDGEQRKHLMDTVRERDNGAEHCESYCSLDLSRDITLYSTVFC